VNRLVNFIAIASFVNFASEFDRKFVVAAEFVAVVAVIDFEYFAYFVAISNLKFITGSLDS
jgi:hypothetical protein